jgi:hypothetical protein
LGIDSSGVRHVQFVSPGRWQAWLGRLRLVGVAVGVLSLLGLAVWTSATYRGAVGADSPGQAVERFLDSLERGDAVGVAQVLMPIESRLVAPEAQRLVRQLRRFGSLAETSSAREVSRATRRWQVASVSSQFALVEGELAMVKVRFDEYPASDRAVDGVTKTLDRGRAGRWVRHFLTATGTDRDRSVVMVTARLHGRSYVSLTNTIAQAWARLAERKNHSGKNASAPHASGTNASVTGIPAPNTSATTNYSATKNNEGAPAIANSRQLVQGPIGAETAEQAVQAWLDALVDLDYQALSALTNPVEADAFPLQAITTVWVVRIDKLRRQFELSVPEAPGQSQIKRGRFGTQVIVPVTIRDAKFALTEPGAEPFVAQYHEGCLVILSGGKATKHCGRQIPRFGEQFSVPVSKKTIDRFVGRIDALEAARRSLPGFVVVQSKGRWFVSPTQTLLLNLGEGLSNAKHADVEALVADVGNAISSDG